MTSGKILKELKLNVCERTVRRKLNEMNLFGRVTAKNLF